MLVLTRRIDEEIVIGGSIYLKVLRIQGPVVRIGITAPASVRVARSELLRVNVSPTEDGVQVGRREQLVVLPKLPEIGGEPARTGAS